MSLVLSWDKIEDRGLVLKIEPEENHFFLEYKVHKGIGQGEGGSKGNDSVIRSKESNRFYQKVTSFVDVLVQHNYLVRERLVVKKIPQPNDLRLYNDSMNKLLGIIERLSDDDSNFEATLKSFVRGMSSLYEQWDTKLLEIIEKSSHAPEKTFALCVIISFFTNPDFYAKSWRLENKNNHEKIKRFDLLVRDLKINSPHFNNPQEEIIQLKDCKDYIALCSLLIIFTYLFSCFSFIAYLYLTVREEPRK